MKESTKKQKALDQLAQLLKGGGVELEEVPTLKDLIEPEIEEPDASYEAEAVLSFINSPSNFLTKRCLYKECGKLFSANYHAVGYCSDKCRMLALKERGISWNPNKTQWERWSGEPPLVVPSSVLLLLLDTMKKLGVPDLSDVQPHLLLASDVQEQTTLVEQPLEPTFDEDIPEFPIVDF